MFTPEIIEKGRLAKTPEELIKIAAENGVTLNGQEAIDAFNRLHPSKIALTPDELDEAAGGCNEYRLKSCPNCGSNHVGGNLDTGIYQCYDCGYVERPNCP